MEGFKMPTFLKDIIYLVRHKIRDEGMKVLQDDNYLSQVVMSNLRDIMITTLSFRKQKVYTSAERKQDAIYTLPDDFISLISVFRETQDGKLIRYYLTTTEHINGVRNLIANNVSPTMAGTHYYAFVETNKIIILPNYESGEKLITNYFYAVKFEPNIDPVSYALPEDFPQVLVNALVSKVAYDLYNEGKVNYNLLPPNISEIWYFDYQNTITNYILNKKVGSSILEVAAEQNKNPYF